MTKVARFLRRFSVLDFLKAVRLNTKSYCSCFYFQSKEFLWLDFQHTVLLIKEEIRHRSNRQLL